MTDPRPSLEALAQHFHEQAKIEAQYTPPATAAEAFEDCGRQLDAVLVRAGLVPGEKEQP